MVYIQVLDVRSLHSQSPLKSASTPSHPQPPAFEPPFIATMNNPHSGMAVIAGIAGIENVRQPADDQSQATANSMKNFRLCEAQFWVHPTDSNRMLGKPVIALLKHYILQNSSVDCPEFDKMLNENIAGPFFIVANVRASSFLVYTH